MHLKKLVKLVMVCALLLKTTTYKILYRLIY